VGRIKSCTKEGVYISLGFFDDILLPPEALQHPSKFDENDQVLRTEAPQGQNLTHRSEVGPKG
jgi:DNA-directed RNA polymerase III subunit RPC8